MDKAAQMEIARKQIKLYQDALALCPAVMEVVKRFDGKVANKRLETALEAVDRGLCCRKSSYTEIWEISFYTSDRCVTVKETGWNGNEYYGSHYIKDSEYYLARDMFKNTYGAFVDADGRWVAENINKQIEKSMEGLVHSIEVYENMLAHVDELEEERDRLRKEVEAHNRKVTWIGEEYFKLKV